jgi:predicted GIY-YIG superfamily endonuclease
MWYNRGNNIVMSEGASHTTLTVINLFRRFIVNIVPHFVYELVDPRDMSVFYVGITIDLYDRFRQHMHCSGKNPQKDQRIQEILEAGHLPVMRTVELANSLAQALLRETYWIHHHLQLGTSLVNVLEVPGKVVRGPRVMRPIRKDNLPNGVVGRARKRTDVLEMLTVVHDTGAWPADISPQMQRYYRREYPEFFQNSKRSRRIRALRLTNGYEFPLTDVKDTSSSQAV